jgi:hypothetical protein
MKKFTSLFLMLAFVVACSSSEDDPTEVADNFDRNAMLVNWADNIIIPSYEAYGSAVSDLKVASDAFNAQPDLTGLSVVREKWLEAYLAFQQVSIFEIGPAETISLRNYTNIYPADANEIEGFVASNDFNLSLPSTNDAQGFPALDYMLYGTASTDAEILDKLSTANYSNYLDALVTRLQSMSELVRNEWQGSYRDAFVANNGSTASSSVNKLMNDFLFYYEKSLRAGKIGIPAGVFSGSPLSDRVEGLYSKSYSKQLFNTALEATIDFFIGKHHGSTVNGSSIEGYLEYLSEINNTEDLSLSIRNQFAAAKAMAQQLNDNFFEQVETDNSKMLQTYDELQKNVILMKVDMFQKMNVRIDYVDADGD